MSVYKIYKEGDDNFYIGSTKDFNLRKSGHKYSCKKGSIKLYNYINENGGWDCFKMEVLEYCLEYRQREKEIIKQLKPSLNSTLYDDELNYNRQYESNKRYAQNHKETKKQYDKEYRKKNKVKRKEVKKKWYKKNKEEVSHYQKKYRDENKDKIKAYQTKYKSYHSSWGGDERYYNNLLRISVNLFK